MARRTAVPHGAAARAGWVVVLAVVLVVTSLGTSSAALSHLPGAKVGTSTAPSVVVPTRPQTDVDGQVRTTAAASPGGSAGTVVRTVFPGYNTSLPGSFTSSISSWVVGTPTYVPTTNTVWFPQRTEPVAGYPLPALAPIAVFNVTSGDFAGFLTNVSNASALVFDPGNGYVYAAVASNDSVVVVNAATGRVVDAGIPVGDAPVALSLDANLNELFVANSGSSSVSIINTVDDQVSVPSVPVGPGPSSLAYDQNNGYVFVANAGSGASNISVINATDPQDIIPGIPIYYSPVSELAYSPRYGNLVATDPSSPDVTVVNATKMAVKAITDVGFGVLAAETSPNGTEFVVANSTGSDLEIVNASNGDLVGQSIQTGENTSELVLDSRSGTIYTWASGPRVVEAFNAKDRISMPSTITTSPGIVSLSSSEAPAPEYAAAAGASALLSLSSTDLDQIGPPVVLTSSPLSVVHDPSDGWLYVGTSTGVVVYNASNNLVGTVADLSGTCDQMVPDFSTGLLWLVNGLRGVTAVSITNLTVELSTGIVVPSGAAQAIAVDPIQSEVFVLTSSSAITVLNASSGVTLVSHLVVGTNVTSLIFDPADQQVYAAGDEVELVNATSLSVDGEATPFSTGTRVVGITYDSSRSTVDIASVGSLAGKQGSVTVLDGSSVSASESSATEIPVGEDPDAFGVVSAGPDAPSGSAMVWVANALSGTISVLATPPEIASFVVTPSAIDLGYPLSVAVSYQGGAGNSTIRYLGLPPGCVSADVAALTCTPSANGTFPITVVLTDSLGESVNASAVATVLPALAIETSFSPPTFPYIDVGMPFNGTATASFGLPPYTYAWSFGDGTTGSGANVSHVFADTGTFVVSARATDRTGAENSSSVAVIVVPRPTVSIAESPENETDVALPISFYATTVGGTGALEQTWKFGDGTGASGPNASHEWTRPGVYNVTFRYTDVLGATANQTIPVTIHPSLAASFSTGNESASSPATPGTPVTFTSTVSGGTPPYRCVWSFGDNSSAFAMSVVHRYASPGTYIVHATLVDAVGATVETNLTVLVVENASSTSGGVSTLTGSFDSGLFLGGLLGGVLAASVLFVAGRRRRAEPPAGPVSPYVPP